MNIDIGVEIAEHGTKNLSAITWITWDEDGRMVVEGSAVFANREVAKEIVRRWRVAEEECSTGPAKSN